MNVPKFQIGEEVQCNADNLATPRRFLSFRWFSNRRVNVTGIGRVAAYKYCHTTNGWLYCVPAVAELPFREHCLRKIQPRSDKSFEELMSSLGGRVVA